MKLAKLTVLWPAIAVVIFDQIAKYWVRSSMPLWRSHHVIGSDFFRLTHVENTGVAFGIKAGSPLFLICFSSLASIVLLYFIFRPHQLSPIARPYSLQMALSLILGGAFGNLIDRVIFGKVTDFLDFDFPDFIMTRWPTFNIADSAVTIGVCFWALLVLLDAFQKSPVANPMISDNPVVTEIK